MQFDNGVAASEITEAAWVKSSASKVDNCVEVTTLEGGGAAFRNSRFPAGPALVFTRGEVEAFLTGAKDDEFDYLVDL
ncbi:DUF397 domain-containing protein [Streptomyces decoyicus]|uniref:DUF397 domain-containing protein n=1 Tax=Streptomyces decoyicus TaxID=249567 RepID=UPI003667E622